MDKEEEKLPGLCSNRPPRTRPVGQGFGTNCIGEGPEYRPFCDLRSVPKAARLREQVKIHGRAGTHVLFLCKAELGFFHFLEIVTGWLVPSVSQKISVQPGWYLPLQKIQLADLKYRVKNPMEALPGLEPGPRQGNSPRLGPRIREEPPPWGSF
jgi:hypothetical protein